MKYLFGRKTVIEVEITNASARQCNRGKQGKTIKFSLVPTLYGQLIFLTLQSSVLILIQYIEMIALWVFGVCHFKTWKG